MTYKQILQLETAALQTVKGAVLSRHPDCTKTYAATCAADALRWLGQAGERQIAGRCFASEVGIGAGLIFKAREELGWSRSASLKHPLLPSARPWGGPSK